MNNAELREFFITCVKENDATAWNQFRRKNRKLTIDFTNLELVGYELSHFNLKNIDFTSANFGESTFKLCAFDKANLVSIGGFATYFDECSLVSASMVDANFSMAKAINSDFRYVDWAQARIHQVDLENCKCDYGKFIKTSFNTTSLIESTFNYADLSGCEITNCELNGARFEAAIVSGDTIIWDCYYDELTDFTGVGLSGARIEPALLSSFQCNIRRIWWHNWYRDKKQCPIPKEGGHFFELLRCRANKWFRAFIHFIVKTFWWITDYGSSTIRLIGIFSLVTVAFAVLYTLVPTLTNDAVLIEHQFTFFGFIRALYFAVVIMTSVGFGDIAASHQTVWGHVAMMIQSLIGYILLGAFLVRIGILFQGEFPVSKNRLKGKNKNY